MFNYRYRPVRRTQALNRLFDESVVNPQLLNPTVAALPLDVWMSGDEYVIRAITLRGEIAAPEADEQARWLLRERRHGKFARTLTLPTEVEGAKAEATIENGVLTVRLPKAETARPKTIKIAAK